MEEEEQSALAEARARYEDLIQKGGRPTCPIQPSHVDDAMHRMISYEMYCEDVVEYSRLLHLSTESYRLLWERMLWTDFQRFHREQRETPEQFEEYRQNVHGSRCRRGFEDSGELQRDLARQSKLEEWKEYHAYVINEHVDWERRVRIRRRVVQRNGGQENPNLYRWRTLRYAELNRDAYADMLSWMEGQLPIIAQEVAKRQRDQDSDGKASPSPGSVVRLMPAKNAPDTTTPEPSTPGPLQAAPQHSTELGLKLVRNWIDARRPDRVMTLQHLSPPDSTCRARSSEEEVDGSVRAPPRKRRTRSSEDESGSQAPKRARLPTPSRIGDDDDKSHAELNPTAVAAPETPNHPLLHSTGPGKRRGNRNTAEGLEKSWPRRRRSDSEMHGSSQDSPRWLTDYFPHPFSLN